MPSQVLQKLDIFISSPSDVQLEREIVLRAIERLNRLSYIREQYLLYPLAYEYEVPPRAGQLPQLTVDEFMSIQDSYIVICILWDRMGTAFIHPKTGERYESGTEYEFLTAYNTYRSRGEPHVMVYRKTVDNPLADSEQKSKVSEFFNSIHGTNSTIEGLYKPFETLDELERIIFEDIERILHRYPPHLNEAQWINALKIPDLFEEERRLDVAVSAECWVGQPTEIIVQLCMPYSDGFKSELSNIIEITESTMDAIAQQGYLYIAFPVNKRTGKPNPALILVEIRADDFLVPESSIEISLNPKLDSNIFYFRILPKVVREQSPIYIVLKQQTISDSWVELGRLRIVTTILGGSISKLTRLAINVASISLSMFTSNQVRSNYATLLALKDTNNRANKRFRKRISILGRRYVDAMTRHALLDEHLYGDNRNPFELFADQTTMKDSFFEFYNPSSATSDMLPMDQMILWALNAIMLTGNLDQMRFVVNLFPIIQTSFFIENLERVLVRGKLESEDKLFERLEWLGTALSEVGSRIHQS